MTEEGFVKGQSDNLPLVDSMMVASFFSRNSKYVSAEMRGIKTAKAGRSTYGDNAIGYVQLRRSGGCVTIKARITPEHRVHQKCYSVVAVIDEMQNEVISTECLDCAASIGGCKHAIAFIMWLHRRSEEPSVTSKVCYWKKSKLSRVGSSVKFVKASDFELKKPIVQPDVDDKTFFKRCAAKFRKEGLKCQINKYLAPTAHPISLHYLVIEFKKQIFDDSSFQSFIYYCSDAIPFDLCHQIQSEIKNQADNSLWYELRYGRITASKLYEVAHCCTPEGALCEKILGAKKIKDTVSMARGRKLENFVFQAVENKLGKRFEKCGLFINPKFPLLGASPDGINADYVLEIKCPSKAKTFQNYITCDKKIQDKYLAQIQLQMLLADRKKGLICVAFPDFEQSKQVEIICIDFDPTFFSEMIEKALIFWANAIFPVLMGDKKLP